MAFRTRIQHFSKSIGIEIPPLETTPGSVDPPWRSGARLENDVVWATSLESAHTHLQTVL